MCHFIIGILLETAAELDKIVKCPKESCSRNCNIWLDIHFVDVVSYAEREIWPAIVIDKHFDMPANAIMMRKSSDKIKAGRAGNDYNAMEENWVSESGELLASGA